MTYEFFAKFILTQLTEEQKQKDITIFVSGPDEFFKAKEIPLMTNDDNDVLGPDHLFLEI